MRRSALIGLALAPLLASGAARAAGWDTPILYSAEHMGMGGAAIGYVDDPSAIFHNPAGLAATRGLTLMANATFILSTITSSPKADIVNVDSEPITALAPLIAASYTIDNRLTVGLAFYPVASAGATYKYVRNGKDVENTTTVRFLEVSPSVAFRLAPTLSLGFGYRMSYVSLDRLDAPEVTPLDFTMTGLNFRGVRVGLQWQPIPELQLGLVYRHKTVTELEDDQATVIRADQQVKASGELVLPTKFGLGARVNLGAAAVVLDLEYTLQSESDELIIATDPASILTVNSVFRWKDTLTARAGVEYGLDDTYFLRAGFVYDTQASQEKWPSAFGTPPGPSYTGTLGFGWKPASSWDLNFAVAYRSGSAEVTQDDVNAGLSEHPCQACAKAGDYNLWMLGTYLDFTYRFE